MKELYEELTQIVTETNNCTFTLYYRKIDQTHTVRVREKVFKSTEPEIALQEAITFIDENRTNIGLTGYRLD